jgi:hypothetical protein
MTNESIGLTIRLPRPLHKQLADRAKAEGRSINQEVIRLLQESLNSIISREEVILQEIQKSEADLDQLRRSITDALADLNARASRLEAKMEGEPRRMRDKDVTVADVAKQPTGAKY